MSDSQRPPSTSDSGRSGRAPAKRSTRTPKVSRPLIRAVVTGEARPGQAPAVTMFDVQPGHFCLAHYRNIAFTLWHETATPECMQRASRLEQHLARLYPEGHSNVTFVRAGIAMPDAQTSELLARSFDPQTSQLHCMAVIAEGEGFWASGLRATMLAARQAAKGELELRIFASIPEAAPWFAEAHGLATGLTLTQGELTRLAQRAYTAMQEAVAQGT